MAANQKELWTIAPDEHGTWVQAWVWVPAPYSEEESE